MFHSQFSKKLGLALAVASFIAVAGCSGQQGEQAANQAPKANPPAKAAPKAAVAKPAVAKGDTPKVTPVSAKATQPTGPVITVPKGTQLTAVVDQTLRSTKTHEGDTFAASLAAPVKIDGKTVLPKGAHVTGKVVHVKKNELKVELASVTLHGKSYDLETNTRRPSDKVKFKATDKNADKSKEKKTDNSTLAAKTELTFKLSKSVTVPAKG
jgi:glucose/arabinose dehydrogenase